MPPICSNEVTKKQKSNLITSIIRSKVTLSMICNLILFLGKDLYTVYEVDDIMAKLTQALIFDVAEKLIYEQGMEKTTLYDIAFQLDVSHAALYRHYKNKEDLFRKLALHWLDKTSGPLLTWPVPPDKSWLEALHDWLWLLATTKKYLYQHDQRMFKLYTNYIENNQELVREHVAHLAQKAEEVSGLYGKGAAIVTAFTYFHNPHFAERWSQEGYEDLFESVFKLLFMD